MVCNVEASVDAQLCIAHTISQAHQRSFPIRIMNASSSSIELHTGKKIASFYQCLKSLGQRISQRIVVVALEDRQK